MKKNQDCIFCKIAKGEVPAEKVYEDSQSFVILDKFPAVEGQCLVISKQHVPYFAELDDSSLSHLTKVSKKTAAILDKTFDTIRTCLFIEGFEVPHVHIKLYPVKKGIPLDIKKTAEAPNEKLKEIANRIRKNFK